MEKIFKHLGLFLSYLLLFTVISVFGKLTLWVLAHSTAVASFSQMADIIWWGLKFDLSIAAVSSLLIFIAHDVFRNKLKVSAFVLFALIAVQVVAIFADAMYFKHVGRHIVYEYKTLFENFSDLVLTGIGEHTVTFILMILIVILGFYLSKIISQRLQIKWLNGRGSIANQVLTYFVILLVAVVAFRGGPTGSALKPQHFYIAKDSRYAVLGWNPLYYMFHSIFFKAKYQYPQISTDEESIAVWKKYFSNRPKEEIPPREKMNVVYILLESWTGEYSSESVTPFFNELSKKSLTTVATVAGGQRTTEGIFAIFCSFQNPLGLTIPDGNLNFLNYSCLPEFLTKNGWSSLFVQGTRNETSNVGPFAQKVGFETSVGKHAYKAKTYPENAWGYYDQDIYDYSIERMDEMKEPFVLGINTNTTHSVQLPPGEKFAFGDSNPEEVYKSVLHFADKGLEEFFKKVETKKYFSNTIFVLIPDHAGFSVQINPAHRFLISAMIYAPSVVKPQKIDVVSTQRDFSPTVLDILGGYLPSLAGESLLKKDRSVPPSEFYYNSKLISINTQRIVSYDLASRQNTCYDFTSPEFAEIACGDLEAQAAQEMKAFTRMSQSLLLHGKTKELMSFDQIFNEK